MRGTSMIFFDDVLKIAKSEIKKWSEYSNTKELTLIRDALGHISVLISHSNLQDNALETLKQSMKIALGHYFSERIYYKEKAKKNDFEKKIIAEIEKLRYKYSNDNNCSWYVLERSIAKKAWLDQSGTRQAIWDYNEAIALNKPKVISFYSFKGGMGRTTALAASALLLAQQGYNVLAIDTDIEAPGLSTFFFDDDYIKRGTVDFFVEYQASNSYSPDMREYLLEVTDESVLEENSGKIFILPAGEINNSYLSKLARIDYQDVVEDGMRNTVVRLIEHAVNFLESRFEKVDYILLDARAGFHDMGGVITFQIPHGIVLVGRDNKQSWDGIKKAITLAATTQNERIPFILVDSMCDAVSSMAKQQRESFKKEAYTVCCDLYYPGEQPGIEATDEAHTPVYVPYDPILSEEICLYSDGSQEQNEQVASVKGSLCGKAYQELVRRICSWF